MQATLLGVLTSASAAIFYGVNIVYARMAAQGGLTGPDLILHRIAIMALCLTLVLLVLRRKPLLSKDEFGMVALIALCTSMVGLFYFSAVMFVPVAVAAIVFYTFPLLILLLSLVMTGERPGAAKWLTFALCFTGLVIALGLDGAALDGRGLALAFAAAIAAALQYILIGRMKASDTLSVMVWTHIMALPLVLAIVVAFGGPAPMALLTANAYPVVAAMLLYIGGLSFLFITMKFIPASLSGLIFYIEPVVAVLAAALLLNEAPTSNQYAGGGLVLATLIGFGLYDLRRRP